MLTKKLFLNPYLSMTYAPDNYTALVAVKGPKVNPPAFLNSAMLNVTAFPGCLLDVFPKELNTKMPY